MPALAEPGTPAATTVLQLEPVHVTGKPHSKASVSLELDALPTATTRIGRKEIERTNVGRDYTDLLRRVPGVVAYNYGQGDIGSPVQMRGHTGNSHGGDVAIYVDGVPQNFPSASQGGSGMSDLSWLTPEMIETMEVVKGPASVMYGDQNRAGALNITTRRGGHSSVGLKIGSFGSVRATGVYAGTINDVHLFGVADVFRIKGYRENSDQRRAALFGKASIRAGGGW